MPAYSHPIRFIDRIAAWFDIRALDFRLSRVDRRRLVLVSSLPALVLVGDILLFYLQAFHDTPFPAESTLLDGTDPGTSTWERLYHFASGMQTPVVLIAVALLFVYSIAAVPRSQASWALVVTVNMVCLSFVLALLSALPRSLADSSSAIRDWYVQISAGLAFHLGFLAIGYAFLAFRGLSVRQLPRGRRVRIPPPQPREL